MKIWKWTAIVAAALTLGAGTGWSQTNTNTGPTLLKATFSAVCDTFDPNRGRVVRRHLTERNIIAQSVGLRVRSRALIQNYALVYNVDADSLQVMDTNGTVIVDVVDFGGGRAVSDDRQLDRLAFMFFPGQTNEFGVETNVFGTALITQQTTSDTNGTVLRRVFGRLQFSLAGGYALGLTNVVGLMGTNGISDTNLLNGGNGFFPANSNVAVDESAQVCSGIFVAGRNFGPATGTATSFVSSPPTSTRVVPPISVGTNGIVLPGDGGTNIVVIPGNGITNAVVTPGNGITNTVVVPPGGTDTVVVPGGVTNTVTLPPMPGTNTVPQAM